MNIAQFAEELTQLIIRWKTPVTPKIGEDAEKKAPLTNQQIFETAQDVFRAVLQIDGSSSESATMTTPATGIVIMTPDAPIVPKIKPENSGSLGRYRSLDTLTSGIPAMNIFNFPDPGSLTAKNHDEMDGVESESSGAKNGKGVRECSGLRGIEQIEEIDPNNLDAIHVTISSFDSKQISRSSPAMNVTVMGRSDTFVRKEEDEKFQNANDSSKTGEEDDAFITGDIGAPISAENTLKFVLLPKLEAIRKCLFDAVSKLDDVKKQAFPDTAKPIRRLSSIGGFPGLNRASTTQASIPPPKMRRSFSAFPGTPTSSRLNVTITKENPDVASRRKSISTASLHGVAPSNCTVSTNRPSPNLSSQSNKKSPSSSGRPAKNPKYAHVQSTIPKASVAGKRKAQ